VSGCGRCDAGAVQRCPDCGYRQISTTSSPLHHVAGCFLPHHRLPLHRHHSRRSFTSSFLSSSPSLHRRRLRPGRAVCPSPSPRPFLLTDPRGKLSCSVPLTPNRKPTLRAGRHHISTTHPTSSLLLTRSLDVQQRPPFIYFLRPRLEGLLFRPRTISAQASPAQPVGSKTPFFLFGSSPAQRATTTTERYPTRGQLRISSSVSFSILLFPSSSPVQSRPDIQSRAEPERR
jgi:hypothetical protein